MAMKKENNHGKKLKSNQIRLEKAMHSCAENIIKPVCLVSVLQLFDNWLLMFPKPLQPSLIIDANYSFWIYTIQIYWREYQWGKRSCLHYVCAPLLAPRLLAGKSECETISKWLQTVYTQIVRCKCYSSPNIRILIA